MWMVVKWELWCGVAYKYGYLHCRRRHDLIWSRARRDLAGQNTGICGVMCLLSESPLSVTLSFPSLTNSLITLLPFFPLAHTHAITHSLHFFFTHILNGNFPLYFLDAIFDKKQDLWSYLIPSELISSRLMSSYLISFRQSFCITIHFFSFLFLSLPPTSIGLAKCLYISFQSHG